jgi:hypothetical protein
MLTTGHSYPSIKFSYTSSQEIGKIIKLLKTKNSHGYNEISATVQKWSTPFIISPLTYICNLCLELGTFPSRLKFSVVKPIYTTGGRLNITNFLPISLLTSFSKVFEKIIYSRMYQHVVQYQIFVKEQYGFRSKLSTDNASYTLIHEILTAMNNKQVVGGIFCDLRKALDYINHRI